jgi:hypothetical protein
MKKITQVLAVVAATVLTASITWGAPPAGGMAGGMGGGMGARGGGGGRGNSGDTAPSNLESAHSLSKPTTPSSKTDDQGFIKRWSILDPITPAGASSQTAFTETAHKEFFKDQLKVIPKDGEKVTVNGAELAWHQLDTKNFNVNLVHFANDLKISSADTMFWVVTVVNSPDEVKDVRLAIGTNDASWWWFNGQEVASVFNDVLSVPDQRVSKKLTLNKGPNVIRALVHNTRGQTDFCARILDKDMNPITNVTVTLTDGK